MMFSFFRFYSLPRGRRYPSLLQCVKILLVAQQQLSPMPLDELLSMSIARNDQPFFDLMMSYQPSLNTDHVANVRQHRIDNPSLWNSVMDEFLEEHISVHEQKVLTNAINTSQGKERLSRKI